MTIDEQIKEVKREIGMRKVMYPKWVQSDKLRPEKAEHGIAAMEAVLETLTAVQVAGAAQGRLF